MDKNRLLRCANMLYEAEETRRPIRPLTQQFPELDIADAYGIQMLNVQRATGQGYVVAGKKIGLTSAGIQEQMGVNEPDYGHLFTVMECPDGEVETGTLLQPKIEAELAFILKEDLKGGEVTAEDVKKATDYVAAAFEIVDSRIAAWNIKLVDTVADNASSGRYILGGQRCEPGKTSLAAIGMRLYKNGEEIAAGSGAAVLGDPCKAVAWLANKLWGYGVTLNRGEVILSGAFSAAPEAKKGDVFEAEFTQLGRVKAAFV